MTKGFLIEIKFTTEFSSGWVCVNGRYRQISPREDMFLKISHISRKMGSSVKSNATICWVSLSYQYSVQAANI